MIVRRPAKVQKVLLADLVTVLDGRLKVVGVGEEDDFTFEVKVFRD